MNSTRKLESIHAHYKLEVRLARKLREASKEDRLRLYSEVYDQLFNSIEDHPQLTSSKTKGTLDSNLKYQLNLLKPLLAKSKRLLEIGVGDGNLLLAASRFVHESVGLDTSKVITNGLSLPKNASIVEYDGINIPINFGSFDVVYSHQLLEHLHVDDAKAHIENVFKLLSPGGLYLCITPNRAYGPHDISRGIDKVAKGFHLQEYSFYDLYRIFQEAGYSRIIFVIMVKNLRIPVFPFFFVAYDAWHLCFPSFSIRQLFSRFLGNICIQASK